MTSTNNCIAALLNPRVEFHISLQGFAGRLRLPEGWHTQVSSLPEQLLYYVVEGEFDATLNHQSRRVGAGDLLWAARGTDVDFSARDGHELVILRFRMKAAGVGGKLIDLDRPFLHLTGARSCEMWMEQIVDEVTHSAALSNARQRGLLLCLLTEIGRLGDSGEDQVGRLDQPQREALARYFTENVRLWPSPSDLAHLVELSPDYFSRCFRRTFGVTPRRWLVEERQRIAAVRLLETKQSISQIAVDLGYQDVFLFSRQFKMVFRVSPTKYRQTHSAIERLV